MQRTMDYGGKYFGAAREFRETNHRLAGTEPRATSAFRTLDEKSIILADVSLASYKLCLFRGISFLS